MRIKDAETGHEQWIDTSSKAPIGSAGISILPFGNGAERMLNNKEICIASSKALCTLAGARLISSSNTKFAKIAPRCTLKD